MKLVSQCEICGKTYDYEDDAKNCEAKHKFNQFRTAEVTVVTGDGSIYRFKANLQQLRQESFHSKITTVLRFVNGDREVVFTNHDKVKIEEET